MESCQIVVGVDWADEKHAVFLLDQRDRITESYSVDQTPEAVSEWVNSLHERFPDVSIAVCLEQKRGALIYALMKFDFLTLVPVNPNQLSNFRNALSASECKDDPDDAELLAELAAKHGEHLRVWKPDDEETRLLSFLSEDRRHFVDQRTALTNRLKTHLKQYFPQLLAICDVLHSSLACALLERGKQ